MNKSASECIKAIADSVARRTVQVRYHMTERLADADITVMTGQTVAGNCVRVVKRGAGKGRGGEMTVVTSLIVWSGRDVIQKFTDTNPVVVA